VKQSFLIFLSTFFSCRPP